MDSDREGEDEDHNESKVGPHQPVEEVHFPGYMFGEGKRTIQYVDNGRRHLQRTYICWVADEATRNMWLALLLGRVPTLEVPFVSKITMTSTFSHH